MGNPVALLPSGPNNSISKSKTQPLVVVGKAGAVSSNGKNNSSSNNNKLVKPNNKKNLRSSKTAAVNGSGNNNNNSPKELGTGTYQIVSQFKSVLATLHTWMINEE